MEIPFFNSGSIFDQIESLQPNPECFQFRKYNLDINSSEKDVLKEGFVFFINKNGNEIQRNRICITNEFLVKYSV